MDETGHKISVFIQPKDMHEQQVIFEKCKEYLKNNDVFEWVTKDKDEIICRFYTVKDNPNNVDPQKVFRDTCQSTRNFIIAENLDIKKMFINYSSFEVLN